MAPTPSAAATIYPPLRIVAPPGVFRPRSDTRAAGAGACAQLEQSTLQALEHDEKSSCPRAVLSLELSGSEADSASVWVTSAQVRLRHGDTVFLDETPAGWRVAAAGCKPQPGEEQPYACEVES